jgi:hypothetical protein
MFDASLKLSMLYLCPPRVLTLPAILVSVSKPFLLFVGCSVLNSGKMSLSPNFQKVQISGYIGLNGVTFRC